MGILSENIGIQSKKRHTCNYCGHKIEAGDLYDKTTIASDGTVYDWKSHQNCTMLVKKLNMFEDYSDDGVTSGDFHEMINSKYIDIIVEKANIQLPWEVLYELHKVPFLDKYWTLVRYYNKKT